MKGVFPLAAVRSHAEIDTLRRLRIESFVKWAVGKKRKNSCVKKDQSA